MRKPVFHPAYTPAAPTSDEINLLGSLFNTGRHAELENWARQLLELYPDSGIVWKLFGLSLQMQGKDALPALHRAAELLPGDAEAHGNLAAALRACGQLDAAVASGQRAIKIRPEFAEAHNNLGIALKELGRLDDAVCSYRRAIEIKPDFVEAHNHLGTALNELEQFDMAMSSYLRALEIRPDFAEAHNNLGCVLKELGRLEEAAECFNRALEIDPMCIEAMIGIGQLFMIKGDIAKAEGVYRKALAIKSDNLGALLQIVHLGKVKTGDQNLAALVSLADASQQNKLHLSPQEAIQLDFALGKGFDDVGDYDQAFHYFLEGCRLKRATCHYDANETSRHVSAIMQIFDQPTLERLSGAGNDSSVPIFVLGMPRSGTTLVRTIITSHPDAFGAGELTDLMNIINREASQPRESFPYNVIGLDQEKLGLWASEYVGGLSARAPEAKRITDKLPANFLAVGLIHLMLPNAKIIHVRRNPIDTCLSCFMQLFSSPQEHTYDLEELSRYYADYARLMEHWRKVLPAGAFLDVQYEDIVADQEKQSRLLIDYCGLSWRDACLDFHQSKQRVYTASVAQVRKPIYKSSVERWRNYEKFLGSLPDRLGDLASSSFGVGCRSIFIIPLIDYMDLIYQTIFVVESF